MNTKKLLYTLCLVVTVMCTACNNNNSSERIGLKLTKKGGVYEIPCSVNGVNMKFIFDTGASNVCISLSEAIFLIKNGYINEKDIKGSSYAQLADGNIVENTNIILREINIGGCILKNIEATVVHTLDAPLLLGQSAIKKLGRIEMFGDSLYITPSSSVRRNKELQLSEGIDSVPIFLNLALSSLSKNLYSLAETHIDKALALNSDDWQLNYVKGCALDRMGKSKDGAEYFGKAYANNTTQQDFTITVDDSIFSIPYDNFLRDYVDCLSKSSELNLLSYSAEYETCVLIAQLLYERNSSYDNMTILYAACCLAYYNNNTHESECELWRNKLLSEKKNDPYVYRYTFIYYWGLAVRNANHHRTALKYWQQALENLEKAQVDLEDSSYEEYKSTIKQNIKRLQRKTSYEMPWWEY